jgi:lysophospholipase L1-like esterase
MTPMHLPVQDSRWPAEADDDWCINPDAAAELLRSVPWQRLAIIGDSVAAGVREPVAGYRDASFAQRLIEALRSTRAGFDSINVATPQLTVAEIREQQLPMALAFAPDAVLVTAGGNDAFHQFDSDELRRQLSQLLSPLAGDGAVVLTVGLFDLARSGLVPTEHAGRMARRFDELDELTASVTRSLGGIHIDTHHHPLAADPGLYSSDKVHANARGHAVAFASIVQTIASAN